MVALGAMLLVALAAIGTAGTEPKYKIAAVVALAGSALLAAWPERKIACVVLWVLIHPLSVERVFFIDAAEGPQFFDPSIAINASDGPLALLAIFLLIETAATGRSAFRWSRLTTILLLMLLWSVISYAFHLMILRDGFVTSSPLALLQSVRLLVFVLLIQSGVRSRAEIILALAAVAFALTLQAGFVALSYGTGQLFNYVSTSSGETGSLMRFETAGGGADLVRGVGTVGQTNEQAAFHAFMTIPLVAFFRAGNPVVRTGSLLVIAASTLALVLTFSRGAWLSLPLGLAVVAVIAFRRPLMGKTVVLVGSGMVVAAALLSVVLAQPIYQRLAYGDSGATESRLRMLALARDLFESSPVIGVGPGEFVEAALALYPPRFREAEWVAPGEALPLASPVIGRVDITQGVLNGTVITRPLPVHNKYMLVLSELGLPGLAIWLWFFVEVARLGWRSSKSPDALLEMIGIAGLGVVTTEMVYMLVDLFHEDKPLEIMLFAPALMVSAARLSMPPSGRKVT